MDAAGAVEARPAHREGARRAPAPALSVLGLALGLAGLATALVGTASLGLELDPTATRVVAVRPGLPAWDVGVRPGQLVVATRQSDAPGGWGIETADSAASADTAAWLSERAIEIPLRLSAVAAAAAVVLSLLAFRDARRRPRRSELASALAMVLAASPVVAGGGDALSAHTLGPQPAAPDLIGWPLALAALAAAALAPTVWLARWRLGSGSARAALVAVGGVGAALGCLAFAGGPGGSRLAVVLGGIGADPVTGASAAAVAAAVACVVVVSAGFLALLAAGAGVSPGRASRAARSATVVDLAAVAGSVVLGIGLVAAQWPLYVAAGVALALALAYSRSRGALRTIADRVLLADVRERASIRAAEEERARMAREIHDDPLQAIAGVIQRLEEPDPDTAVARDSLRDVAARLRGVATELHPPVLDDLGLVPAIEAAARSGRGAAPIEVRLDDATGYAAGGRPPAEVELAVFRIAQEAIANAVRHSGASCVTVTGRVGGGSVELVVADDGSGFSEADAQAALRRGRLGVASMRQRAAAVGASLEIGAAEGGGTAVAVRWPA